ncbi:MAG: carboxypeptidase regulatory-like domain-containing protein [Fuerstiella sp.]|nr:hypothetical protein [Fuerstiella sp.]
MELLQYTKRTARRSRRRKALTFAACSCEILEERLVLSASVIDISGMQLNSAGSCAKAHAACVTGCICFQKYLSQFSELPAYSAYSAYRVLLQQNPGSGNGETALVEVGDDLTWTFTNLHPSDYTIQVYAANGDGNWIVVGQAQDVALTPSSAVAGLVLSVEPATPSAVYQQTPSRVVDSTQNDYSSDSAADPKEIQIAVSQLFLASPDASQTDAAKNTTTPLDGRVFGMIVFGTSVNPVTGTDGAALPQEIIIRPKGEMQSDGETRSATTDSNGHFIIDNLKPGEYELLFDVDGNGSGESIGVSVRAGATTRLELTFRLTPPQSIGISPADAVLAHGSGTLAEINEIYVVTASFIAGVFAVETYFASRRFRRDLQTLGLPHP